MRSLRQIGASSPRYPQPSYKSREKEPYGVSDIFGDIGDREEKTTSAVTKKIRTINLSAMGEYLTQSGCSDFAAGAPAIDKGTPTSAMCARQNASNRSGTLAAMFAMGAKAPHLILPTLLPTQARCHNLNEEFFNV